MKNDSKKVELNLAFEEWTIKYDHQPGWTLLKNYFNELNDLVQLYEVWIASKYFGNFYKIKKQFLSINSRGLAKIIKKHIFKDVIIFVKFKNQQSFSVLLSNYSKNADGIVKDNTLSAVFPALVEAKGWINFSFDEKILLIHHDGNLLHFLSRLS